MSDDLKIEWCLEHKVVNIYDDDITHLSLSIDEAAKLAEDLTTFMEELDEKE